jgi:hypothetical protein
LNDSTLPGDAANTEAEWLAYETIFAIYKIMIGDVTAFMKESYDSVLSIVNTPIRPMDLRMHDNLCLDLFATPKYSQCYNQ